MNTETDNDEISCIIDPMEELVLKESIVSTTGINSQHLQIGIKGDQSMRETAMFREKYTTTLDEHFPEIVPLLIQLLTERSIYRIYIGFNSAEIRTCSIFDPMREETHAAEKIVEDGYLDRHFPRISYQDKADGTRELYRYLRTSPLFDALPTYWRNISERRAKLWKPMPEEEVTRIMKTLKVLRDLPGYYLRNATVCIIQNMVRLQFNCDGTQLISADNYDRFLEENLPDDVKEVLG